MMNQDEEILRKLNLLVILQAKNSVNDLNGQKEKILYLSRAGMTPSEIAIVLDTSSNTVNVALSNARKSGEIKKSKGEK